MNSIKESNSERHYILLAVAVVIGIVGIYLRFAGDAPVWSWIANVIFVTAGIIALRGVFRILGPQ